jgi:hypothetical protein
VEVGIPSGCEPKTKIGEDARDCVFRGKAGLGQLARRARGFILPDQAPERIAAATGARFATGRRLCSSSNSKK